MRCRATPPLAALRHALAVAALPVGWTALFWGWNHWLLFIRAAAEVAATRPDENRLRWQAGAVTAHAIRVCAALLLRVGLLLFRLLFVGATAEVAVTRSDECRPWWIAEAAAANAVRVCAAGHSICMQLAG